jgi:hypothetical protein
MEAKKANVVSDEMETTVSICFHAFFSLLSAMLV